MELTEAINNRRSIRRFESTEISDDVILTLIDAATKAPSWKNSQVSRYYVVKELREEVISCLPNFNQMSVENAPVLIVSTVVDKRSGYDREGNYETHLKEGFAYFDNGLQIENLCLKAYEEGLGTLIMGIYDNEQLRNVLEIPEEEIITVVIALGVPAIKPEMHKRKELTTITKFK